MTTVSRTLRVLRLETFFRLLPGSCGLHTSASQHNSNRTSIVRLPRQKYARTYPVLLVRPDGSTIHVRYKEPRQILSIPIDINTLPDAERRARLRKRDAHKLKPKEETPFEDDFKLEDYRKFWKKK
ncbi:39S ribosomal protein L55, mitochondrial [Hemicordylus capensis]|uniref:39S ribosomal protein L55, mitochondrial n=1 Tax=Hemicordylus capensis TaxID=884348 RepID=UPI0023026F37|nr:39S ribosomal protein L55, mitochondrial [Hemicordylus capensis]XP_053121416.1 39S ribosomal protein L55, mitochondrial [Hemicordylus capensis]XP_053121417.1 39S ribosomal protein L55, mitochondrial [Hemicordylus capensis]XP_053121418.1 39S ribosomal protein L55, mitochondrial [Hemicordylus capensis]XP_053121419.1 39S ribosomal protein L55, mitochondrial [Hemicordylus capensis]